VEATALTATGLTRAEARRRIESRGAPARERSSRSYASIVRANVFTVFNLILLVAGTATLAFGEWQDALFLGVLVSNSGIGIFQEVRAKRTLDRLAALVAPTATVVRDGVEEAVAPDELVVGDLVRVKAGDQIAADGRIVESELFMLDESILTGESEPVQRVAARARLPSRAQGPSRFRRSAPTATPRSSPVRPGASAIRARRSSAR